MAGVSESNRQRIAFLLIGLGVGLILIGAGLMVYHQGNAQIQPVGTQPAAVSPETKARAIRQLLFWLVVLVLVFVVSTTAFLRWSRHFRRSLFRKPRPATPSEDVWAMHKLPEGAVEEWTDPGGDSSAGLDEREPPD